MAGLLTGSAPSNHESAEQPGKHGVVQKAPKSGGMPTSWEDAE